MIKLSEWLLESIREENNKVALNSDWLEMERFEWENLLSRTLSHILGGGSVLVCTEERFEWFARYITANLNKTHQSRPLVPVFLLQEIIPNASLQDNAAIYDMLNLSFKDYIFWYIGRPNTSLGKLALGKAPGFFWIFDESMQMSLKVDSKDVMIDYKLIQLYRLFEKALFGVIFGDIILE